MLPRLAFTGMVMLPKALALSALSKSFRLRWRETLQGLRLVAEDLDHLLPVHDLLDVAVYHAQVLFAGPGNSGRPSWR